MMLFRKSAPAPVVGVKAAPEEEHAALLTPAVLVNKFTGTRWEGVPRLAFMEERAGSIAPRVAIAISRDDLKVLRGLIDWMLEEQQ